MRDVEKVYTKGSDFLEEDAQHYTYGISQGDHTNKIEVYDDRELRNYVLKLLNAAPDMLAALKAARLLIKDDIRYGDNEPGAIELETLTMIDAAIRKTEANQ